MKDVENDEQSISADEWHPHFLDNRLRNAQEKVNLGLISSVGFAIVTPFLMKRGIDLSIADTSRTAFDEGVTVYIAGISAGIRGGLTILYTQSAVAEYKQVMNDIKSRNIKLRGTIFNRKVKE
jgi:hypothetical protein